MTRLFALRDRFKETFADCVMIEIVGWAHSELIHHRAYGREPQIRPFFEADHFTIEGRHTSWVEKDPEIALYLALTHAAREQGTSLLHLSGWGHIRITDPHSVDLSDVAICSSMGVEPFRQLKRMVSEFGSNHGQLSIAQRLGPLVDPSLNLPLSIS